MSGSMFYLYCERNGKHFPETKFTLFSGWWKCSDMVRKQTWMKIVKDF